MPTDEPRLDVSVYLLKRGYADIARGELTSMTDGVGARYELRADIPGGEFFSLPAEPAPPRWLAPVSALVDTASPIDIESQSPGAVLSIPHRGKHFLLTFGYGHSKLKQEWIEPDFGKTVALSVIPQQQVHEVRAEQVFARRHIASERAPRAAAVADFGFEADRDMVTAVEGAPAPAYHELLGPRVRGGTSFKLGLLFSKLLPTLDCLAKRYDSGDHKRTWPQANNLSPIRDDQLAAALDGQLDALLASPKAGTAIALAAPAARSGDKPYPEHFLIGRRRQPLCTSSYLQWASWEKHLAAQGSGASVKSARETPVHLLDQEKEEIERCTMYDCLGAEVTHQGRTFILASGTWYEAGHNFILQTNATIAGLHPPAHQLPMWNRTEHEDAYNERACDIDRSLQLFDRKIVSFGGGRSKFEFCDLLHLKSKTLYFVKHPSNSASVSHLSEQVRRTAENMFTPDPAFRQALSKKIRKDLKGSDVSWLADHPQRHEWSLCLVLMGKNAKSLPLFARAGLARLVNELVKSGYHVKCLTV